MVKILVIIVGGPSSNNVDVKLAKILGIKHVKLIYKEFPDGESYIRYPRPEVIKNEDVVIVQSLYKPQSKHIFELLLAIDAAKDFGAKKVTSVVPYLAYSRQDKRFLEGEPISVKTLLKTIKNAGTDYFITVDIHKEYSLKHFGEEAYNVTAMGELAKHIKENVKPVNPIVLAPDKGALVHARKVAEILGNVDYDYLEKKRDLITGEIEVRPKELTVKNRDVIIVDDIISTGGTVALAATSVRKQGARKVIVGCTHALLVGNAREKLSKAKIDYIVATDTVPSEYSKVTVAPAIAEVLKQILKI
ncbi:MAG: ribose-phosphate diphosphokinase [Thermoprotei archaeon]|nr:MAG: ribose-phosphate diphosphokinase [Thermoprotei archaeon]